MTRPRWRLASSGILPGKGAREGGQGRRLQGVRQPGGMALRAAVVRDDPGEAEAPLELRKALDNGGKAPGHSVDIDDQEDRGAEPAGDLGCASLRRFRIGPVEEPHHPLDKGNVGIRRGSFEETADVVFPPHPAVEVVAGPPGGEAQIGRVEEVRPDLEGLDGDFPSARGPGPWPG